jgi:hypothetical protein
MTLGQVNTSTHTVSLHKTLDKYTPLTKFFLANNEIPYIIRYSGFLSRHGEAHTYDGLAPSGKHRKSTESLGQQLVLSLF